MGARPFLPERRAGASVWGAVLEPPRGRAHPPPRAAPSVPGASRVETSVPRAAWSPRADGHTSGVTGSPAPLAEHVVAWGRGAVAWGQRALQVTGWWHLPWAAQSGPTGPRAIVTPCFPVWWRSGASRQICTPRPKPRPTETVPSPVRATGTRAPPSPHAHQATTGRARSRCARRPFGTRRCCEMLTTVTSAPASRLERPPPWGRKNGSRPWAAYVGAIRQRRGPSPWPHCGSCNPRQLSSSPPFTQR